MNTPNRSLVYVYIFSVSIKSLNIHTVFDHVHNQYKLVMIYVHGYKLEIMEEKFMMKMLSTWMSD